MQPDDDWCTVTSSHSMGKASQGQEGGGRGGVGGGTRQRTDEVVREENKKTATGPGQDTRAATVPTSPDGTSTSPEQQQSSAWRTKTAMRTQVITLSQKTVSVSSVVVLCQQILHDWPVFSHCNSVSCQKYQQFGDMLKSGTKTGEDLLCDLLFCNYNKTTTKPKKHLKDLPAL